MLGHVCKISVQVLLQPAGPMELEMSEHKKGHLTVVPHQHAEHSVTSVCSALALKPLQAVTANTAMLSTDVHQQGLVICSLDDGENPFQLLPRDMICKYQGRNKVSIIHLEAGRTAA